MKTIAAIRLSRIETIIPLSLKGVKDELLHGALDNAHDLGLSSIDRRMPTRGGGEEIPSAAGFRSAGN